jgi:hypothetical protein
MRSYLKEKVAAPALTTQNSSIHESWHYISPANGVRSVSIVRLRTKGHEVSLLCVCRCPAYWLFHHEHLVDMLLRNVGLCPNRLENTKFGVQ